MSNCLDPDHEGHFVGPDLDLNCPQRLSADDKIAVGKEVIPGKKDWCMVKLCK